MLQEPCNHTCKFNIFDSVGSFSTASEFNLGVNDKAFTLKKGSGTTYDSAEGLCGNVELLNMNRLIEHIATEIL